MNLARRLAYLRTTTFRLTVFSAAVFAAAAGMIVFYVYGATANTLANQTDRAIAGEVEDLGQTFGSGGPNALNREVTRRSFAGEEFLYLFSYETGRRISGNLDSLPDAIEVDAEPARFQYSRATDEGDAAELRSARGMIVSFPGGYRLLVGRDVQEDERVVGRVAREAWTAAGFIILLGIITGSFLSWRFSHRLEALNAVARDVRAGDFQRRAPRNFSGDELDALAGNLNEMLDRIERLMNSMRYAGDSVAHDLRSPLTRLRSRLEDILRSPDDASHERVRQALEDAEDLLATFNAVLRLSRLEAGEQRTELKRLDPGPLAQDLAELYEPVCEEAGLEFTAEIEPRLVVRADRSLVSQALANLLDNAVKYTPRGGAVALRVRRRSSGQVEISVTDTGPGIPAEDRERVVQRFVRLEESRSTAGSGLGLSLVQAVADIHGATLELDDGPGAIGGEGEGLRAALVFPKAV